MANCECVYVCVCLPAWMPFCSPLHPLHQSPFILFPILFFFFFFIRTWIPQYCPFSQFAYHLPESSAFSFLSLLSFWTLLTLLFLKLNSLRLLFSAHCASLLLLLPWSVDNRPTICKFDCDHTLSLCRRCRQCSVQFKTKLKQTGRQWLCSLSGAFNCWPVLTFQLISAAALHCISQRWSVPASQRNTLLLLRSFL